MTVGPKVNCDILGGLRREPASHATNRHEKPAEGQRDWRARRRSGREGVEGPGKAAQPLPFTPIIADGLFGIEDVM